jgi:hypothetical protein
VVGRGVERFLGGPQLELLFIFLAAGYSNLAKGNIEQGGRILMYVARFW